MLHVHRSANGSTLVEALAGVLAEPPEDPFAPDVVAVPARGVERWLAQRLSHHLGAGQGDGVCARVSFPHPHALLDEAVAAASPELAGSVRAWEPDRAVWPLLEVLDACPPDEQWCAQLVHHLALHHDDVSTRRWAVARRLAGLFATAASSRPALVAGWVDGDAGVPPDLAWQPELWRRLRALLGPSPAELLEPACAALRGGSPVLPRRISLYGVSRLDTARLEVLAALSAQHEVHLWLNHPGPALWEALQGRTGRRRADAPVGAAHPLLVSLSRDVRELQLRLQAHPHVVTHHDGHRDAPRPTATLLARLQRDLREDRVPEVPEPVAAEDRSVQVHACHGRARQVEVLREVVLGLLAEDATLEPRDVLVLCPDVEAFAPLVTAAFGDDQHPGGRLRVALADRAPRQTNPLLGVAGALLDLARSRVTGSQVLDLAGSPAVRRRFGLDDDDLEQLRTWVVGTGVRWGLDAPHRGAWQLQALRQGTWAAGLDRLLTGVALGGDDALLGDVLPYPGLDSSDVDLAGRFAELLDRLDAALARLGGAQPVGAWLDALELSVEELADVPPDGAWQQVQLRRELGEVRAAAAGSAAPLRLADVAHLLGARLEGRPTSTGFRTGGLTVCTLTPMRSVPHRVVCLLGLDDGAFPRHGLPDGDDVLARDPHLGERDPRSEDRQLLLDAVTAAGEHLVVTYAGFDARTGERRPPAVPLGELLDALDLTARAPGGAPVRAHVVVEHPLQPFDPRNFTAPRPLSFDAAALAGARAGRSERQPPPPFLAAPLPPRPEPVVELSRLVEFWQSPAKGLLRQRLDVALPAREEEPDDALPVELDALQAWAVGDRVLRARLAGTPVEVLRRLEAARGELPPGPLGEALLGLVGRRAEEVARRAERYRGVEEEVLDVDVELGQGEGAVRLQGSVPGVRGDVVLTTTYSSLRAKQQLRAWVELLAVTVAQPQRRLRAVVVGRDKDDAAAWSAGPVAPERARALLADLVALRSQGLCAPLPLPVDTAEGWARSRLGGASRAWTSSWGYDKEDRAPEHLLVWGRALALDELLEVRCAGLGLGDLVERVWRPLLEHEVAA